MNCEQALPLLYDLIDGDITSSDRPRLELHLVSCIHCQKELRSLESREFYYRQEIKIAPPANLATNLINNLPQAEQRHATPPRYYAIAASISAITIGLALLIYLLLFLTPAESISNYTAHTFTTFSSLSWQETKSSIREIDLKAVRDQFITPIITMDNILKVNVNGYGYIVLLILLILQSMGSYQLLKSKIVLSQDKQQ